MDFLSFEHKPFFHHFKPFTQFLFLLVFITGSTFLCSAVAQVISLFIWGGEINVTSLSYLRLIQSFSSVGMYLLPSLFFSYCAEKKWFTYNQANETPSLYMVGIVTCLAFLLIPIIDVIAGLNEQIRLPSIFAEMENGMRMMEQEAARTVERMTKGGSFSNLMVNLLLMAVLPAVCEEFLFRGTLQPFFTRRLKNVHIAVWLTAFIFSAIHLQFYGFIPRLLLGAYLGYLFVWSGSLWLPVWAHFLHNSISLIFYYILERAPLFREVFQFSDISGYIPIMTGITLLTFAGIFLLWKRRKRATL